MLDQPRTWLRHGQRGFLHARASCGRFNATKAHAELSLSVTEALTFPTCEECVTDALNGGGSWSALTTADKWRRQLATAQQSIEDASVAPGEFPALLKLVEDPHATRWRGVSTELIATERRRLDDLAADLAVRARALAPVVVERFATNMVAGVLSYAEPGAEMTAPGVDAATRSLLGKDRDRYGRGHRAEQLWDQWLDGNLDADQTTVAELLAHDELRELAQLA